MRIASIIACLLLAALTMASGCSKPAPPAAATSEIPESRRLSIRCVQEGATLWINGQKGPELPCMAELPAGRCRLRVTHAQFPARLYRVGASEDEPLVVDLDQPAAAASLRISSTPAGARIHVDGEARGQTPATLTNLLPGTHRLTLAMPGRPAVERDVELEAGKTTEEDISLPDGLVEYYRAMIQRDSANLDHYAELAHHLVLQERNDEAIDVFVAGIRQLCMTPDVNADRFWQEAHRTLSGQYAVGGLAHDKTFTASLLDRFGDVCRAESCDCPQVCVSYARLLTKVGHRSEADEEVRAIRRKFRDDPSLRRLLAR